MALYILIGLVLASFVIAYFAARTWHWSHVLVVVGIVLSTAGFFILAAETLRINMVYRSAIERKTEQLEQLTARNEALRKGTDDPNIIAQLGSETEPEVIIPEGAESIPSLAELDHLILLSTRSRGRVWRNVAPAGVDAATGAVRVASASLAGLNHDTVVYAFEQGPAQLPAADGTPQGKQYLGEFRVVEASGQQAQLVPTRSLDEFEQRRLAASRGPWVIYETMPDDRYEIFADMNEEELRQKLPAQSVEEYLRHGKEATDADEDIRKLGFDESGKLVPPEALDSAAKVFYQRRLRDYAAEFDELAQQRLDMLVSMAALQKDIDRLTAALDSANKLTEFRKEEIEKLESDLAGVTKERKAIEQHLAQVRQQLTKVRELLAETLQLNSDLVNRLQEIQLDSEAAPGGPLALGAAN